MNHSYRTILIVEDDDALREGYVTLFKELGFPILVAANGLDAMALIRQNKKRIGLVLLDLDIPLLSGEEVYQLIEVESPEIHVVIASARDKHTVLKRLNGKEPITYLQKPFQISSLIDLTQAALLTPEPNEPGPLLTGQRYQV